MHYWLVCVLSQETKTVLSIRRRHPAQPVVSVPIREIQARDVNQLVFGVDLIVD